jgi:hypothetical protein
VRQGASARATSSSPDPPLRREPTRFLLVFSPPPDLDFPGTDDPSEENPDYSSDLWMVDLAREPEIRVSPTAPTLVS